MDVPTEMECLADKELYRLYLSRNPYDIDGTWHS